MVSSTQITAIVTPPAKEPTETATVAVSGNPAATFNVQVLGCPTPKIDTVFPGTWIAGKTVRKVVLTGSGFTTEDKATAACPETPVTILAGDGSTVPVGNVKVNSTTQITLNEVALTASAQDPTYAASLTAGTAPNTSAPATQVQVLGNQIDCDPSMNCTQSVISTIDGSEPVQSVVVGQQIHLITSSMTDGASIRSSKWTVDGTRIANYAPTTASASVKELTDNDLTKKEITYYWPYRGDSVGVTYKFCADIAGLADPDDCSLEAKASFDVTGPTASITATPNSWWVSPPTNCFSRPLTQLLYFGFPDPTSGCSFLPMVKGISFEAELANVPDSGGTTEWVQLLLQNVLSGTTLSGLKAPPSSELPGLDKSYPYAPDDPAEPVTMLASDSPNNPLDPALKSETRRFKADMYYLWRSTIPGSIFVPLEYVEWGTTGSSARSAGPSSLWQSASSATPAPQYHFDLDTGSGHGYPTWGRLAQFPSGKASGAQTEDFELEEQQ